MASVRPWLLGLLLATGILHGAVAAPMPSKDVPPVLKDWMAWVLYEETEYFCPPVFNSAEQRLCNWPSRLVLDVNPAGGKFDLQAANFVPAWVPLPGGGGHWPHSVTVGKEVVPVTARGGTPEVWLDAGVHRISGKFDWSGLPETLQVPADVGLISLRRGGKKVIHLQRGPADQLRLTQRSSRPRQQADRLKVRVFRLLDDDIPLTLTTRIELEVGGQVREELLGPVLPAALVPLQLRGGLPMRIEDNGMLRVQLRPGTWELTVVARSTNPVATVSRPDIDPKVPWPDTEIWSFQSRPALRIVEVEGAAPVDPRQTDVPQQWHGYPAYLMTRDSALKIAEIRRGSAAVTPDEVTLRRQMWLDYDGAGFTIQDELQGSLARTWRLDAIAPLALGAVTVDGAPQLITRHDGDTGVEVRHGRLDVVAESRIDAPLRELPAAGWRTDLQHAHTVLHLPPAWRLLAATGVDDVSETWLARWTLLDLFLVLITTVAALRLFGFGAAALTLVTLVLTWHVAGAPRGVWLNLIAAIALLRALPDSVDAGGRLYKSLTAYKWLSVLALVLVAIPFAIEQARSSLYPQLEDRHGAAAASVLGERAVTAPAADDAMMQREPVRSESPVMESARELYDATQAMPAKVMGGAAAPRRALHETDPNALVQTGPGLPEWRWRTAELSWSGPVAVGQQYRLWLLPPPATRALSLLSIALIAGLMLRWLQIPLRITGGQTSGWLLAVAVGVFAATPGDAVAQGDAVPSLEILQELKKRMTAAPDCMPGCGDWSRMDMAVKGDSLLLRLRGEALTGTALPLPVPQLQHGQDRVWQPRQVFINGKDAAVRRDGGGTLWVQVPGGRHEVLVVGSLRGVSELTLPLPKPPRSVSYALPGWQVSGVDTQGQPGHVIKLTRERVAEGSGRPVPADVGQAQRLPELLQLQRRFELGLQWSVQSSLRRMGDAGGTHIAEIDALPGEVVTGANVRVVKDIVQVSFAPGQRVARWRSSIDVKPELALTAKRVADMVEVWEFDVSPLWHVEFTGIPAISHQQNAWRLVTFRPWPGEAVTATVARPDAVAGRLLTLDSAHLETRPGRRATDYRLRLSFDSSQGGQHHLPLPETMAVQSLAIDGRTQTPRREGGALVLPLAPGQQNFELQLRENIALEALSRTPSLALGLPGVNANLTLVLPRDRWVLFAWGPALGPAVMFWGVLLVLLAIGFVLGRSALTPLNSWQWMLLMIGLSQLPVAGAAIVVGWLFALGLRANAVTDWSSRRFNAMQVLLVLWTLLALATLFGAVAQGLLGAPDMQIAGNGSSNHELRWYQDRFDEALPSGGALSVSIWVYRGLMLLWALWLANALLNWLRWGWGQFSSGGLWKKSAPAAAAGPDRA